MKQIKLKKCNECNTLYKGVGSYNLRIPVGIKRNGKPKMRLFKQIPLCETCLNFYEQKDGIRIEKTKKG